MRLAKQNKISINLVKNYHSQFVASAAYFNSDNQLKPLNIL